MLYDFTVDQVRNELATIINANPNNTGRVEVINNDGYDDGTCVYYKDEDGNPIDLQEEDDYYDPEFVEPVCIVGHWIEDFHPELKNDPKIRTILRRNHSLRGVSASGIVFDSAVWSLLAETQRMQDRAGARWSDIDFSIL
jgi:hypothetical protein